MTREEQTASAYKDYLNNGGMLQSNPWFAFRAGANWADENIKEIWHSTDEYPEEFSDIVIVDKKDDFWKIHYFSGDFDNHNHDLYGWPACIDLYNAKLWAYVSDLLPKTK